MNKQVVVALSADTATVTFYTQSGEVITLKQGDERLDAIMELVHEPLKNNIPVLVDFEYHASEVDSEWNDIETKSKGVIKFFRVAKKKVKQFFEDGKQQTPHVSSFISPQELGKIPGKESYSSEGAPSKENAAIPPAPELPEEATDEVVDSKPVKEDGAIDSDDKRVVVIIGYNQGIPSVAALKGIRTVARCGLKEAKDYLEQGTPCILEDVKESADFELNCKQAAELGVEVIATTYSDYLKRLHQSMLKSQAKPEPVVEPEKPEAPKELTNDEKLDLAEKRMVALTQDAISPSNPEFHKPLKEDETIIAVTAKGGVLPEAEKIRSHIRHTSKLSDFKGFQNFVDRVSAVIPDRKHSMEDLMNFLSTADLPIADNGDIIIFKRLRRIVSGHTLRKGEMKAEYVDCHSQNVGQRVGSLVYMDASRVNSNRNQSCAVGLHVATLQYLGQFHGDVTIIGRVRPEDVITVPHNEHTKVRVAAYHILAELPDTLRVHVNSGKSLSDHKDGAVLLHRAITGNFPEPNQHVYITGERGASVTYKDVSVNAEVKVIEGEAKTVVPMDQEIVHVSKEIKPADLVTAKSPVLPEVTVKAEPKAKPKAKTKTRDTFAAKGKALPKGKKTKMTNSEQAKLLWETFLRVKKESQSEGKDAARELQSFKTQTKKGWAALGLPKDTGDKLKNWLD